ncbi:amino acid adenylation domain-containing protein [Streptomyces sp. PvR034]|uniref:non-ribosomal peptide synthetase n=1 Tax=Streptomyces sp. PvR034 TaxID=3156401 RepID=UPI00339936F3
MKTPATPTLGAAFTAVARTHRHRTALVHGDLRITYGELADRATLTAGRLAGQLEPGELVGIHARRSPETITALLAVVLAGGAYLPLDPEAPHSRTRDLVENSGVRMVFADRGDLTSLRAALLDRVDVLALDEAVSGPVPDALPRPDNSGPDPLAYVIHTSGSTGRPKGVQVGHRSVLALAHAPEAGLRPDDVVLQLAPLHVDPSVFEIWGALLSGARLVLPETDRPGVHEIGRECVRHGVTVLRLAAPLFRLAMEHITADLRGLRLCVSGGDRAGTEAVRTALRELPGCRVVNGYGPTETTVYACWQVLDGPQAYDDSWPDVPIGRPFAGATAHVLRPDRTAAAPGEEGELCVGGTGVARGYLGQPGLTAERFIPEPGRPGRTAYLTGDRVRQLPDGSLAFLGRSDDQVKIRGHRVEPAETERALLGHRAVCEAVVVPYGAATGSRRLAAFVVLAPGQRAPHAELTAHAARLLPAPAVPARVTVLSALPVTANGKADRRRLAERAERSVPAPGPRRCGGESAGERAVAAHWEAVLGRPPEDLDTDFFTAGGDSLTAMAVLARLERGQSAALTIADFLETPTVRGLGALVDAAAVGPDPAPASAAAVTPADPIATAGEPCPGRFPLLPGQRGIWFEQQAAPGGRYTIPRTFLVRGPLRIRSLRTALTRLGERQAALRTAVRQDPDDWWQTLTEDPGAALRHIDLTRTPTDGREERARALVREQTAADPGTGYVALVRTLVITLGPDRTVVHFDIHHTVADDWSLDLFLTELSALYRAPATATAVLPPLRLSYADHLRQALSPRPGHAVAARDFWRDALDGGAAVLDLVTDFPRPALLSGSGDRVRLRMSPEQAARQGAAARRHGVSPYMFCLAGVYTVLAAYAERDVLCLGTLAAGRDRPGTRDLIGYFANLLPVRIEASADTPVPELLARIRAACVLAFRHQEVPLQSVVRELNAATAARAAVPFQAVVNYQHRQPCSLEPGDAEASTWPTGDRTTAKFELAFHFQESGDGLDLEVEFSTDLYTRATAERLAAQLAAVLHRLVDAPTLRDAELFEPGERERLLAAPETEAASTGPDATVHALVARQAAAHPDKTAVIGADTTLTYRELDRISDAVAARLAGYGIGAGDRVAVCLERSPRLITAILGVLKTGAAYVPLDPAYPAQRLRHVTEDAGVRALVSAKEISDALFPPVAAGEAGPPVLDVDALTVPADEEHPAVRGPGPDAGEAPSGDPAYIIYTSGSTGRPRGVVVSHRAVANTLYGSLARHPFTSDDVWLQLTSPGFDVAAFEQFMPLVSGATLVYADDATRGDGAALTRALRAAGVTAMVTVPSLLRALDRPDLADVRVLLVAGEPADVHDTRHFARDHVVINGYGPTEAAILATTHRADPGDRSARVPVGRPLPGTSAHVVDRHGRLAATGVPGELWLGGAGLGEGYWNDPELSARLFTALPTTAVPTSGRASASPAGRFYRTGDRVRRLPDGSIDYLGRLDGQIKLRGFRIELGEIEAALTEHPAVRAAAAVLLGSGADADLAVGYLGRATESEARDHLARLLPAHMVPRLIVPLAAVPTSSHGKADRRALTELLAAHRHSPPPAASDAAAGAGPVERRLLALWHEVLGRRADSLDDDFFALGGHSLRVIRLLGRIEREYGTRIAVHDFLAAPTVRAVARRLGGAGQDGPRPAIVVAGPEHARLDPAVVFTGRSAPARPHDPVLLTGATGFVGAHVLAELLERTRGRVLCLVRAGSQDAARHRIATAVRRYGLRCDPADPRIAPVPGDLALPGLGLTGTRWEREVREARAVFHLGAEVHHVSGFQHLAAANVQGTAELLRIAAADEPARFHHISTLGVFKDDATGPRTITEATGADGERHSLGRGYAAAKWAAEQLVAQAVERGADAHVYRLGRAGGSTGGAISPDDFLTRLLTSSAALGCYPDDPRLATDALPVDTMARAVVALALAGHEAGTVHHIHHPRRTGLGALLSVYDRRTGATTAPVGLATWLHRLTEAEAAGTTLPALAYREHLRELGDNPAAGRLDHRNDATLAALRPLGVIPPDLDDALVGRWWEYLDRSTCDD